MKKTFCFCIVCVFVVGALLTASPAKASVIQWTDWTSQTVGTPGSATGTLQGTSISVTYTGEVYQGWTQGDWTVGTGTYTSSTVSNAPPMTGSIVSIGIVGNTGTTNTITFSAPVINPVMAIQSLGSTNPITPVSYRFSNPFTILSSGEGFFRSQNDNSSLAYGAPNELIGQEGNGVIQFSGTFSSISWTVPNAEAWHMFTVGVPTPSAVPIPSSILLLAPGIAGFIVLRRRMGMRG